MVTGQVVPAGNSRKSWDSSRNQCQGPIFTALDATTTHSNARSRARLAFEGCNGVARRFLFHREPPAYIDSKDRTPADAWRSNSLRSVRSRWCFPEASITLVFLNS